MTQLSVPDKRRSPTGRKYEPKQLNQKHHEILRLALLGYSNVEIAERLHCTPVTVSTVRNSGLGRQQASLLKAEADFHAIETAKRIRELAPGAIETINQIGKWYPGDVLQAAIGQSDNTFTPLQISMYLSSLLNNGTRYKAHILAPTYPLK